MQSLSKKETQYLVISICYRLQGLNYSSYHMTLTVLHLCLVSDKLLVSLFPHSQSFSDILQHLFPNLGGYFCYCTTLSSKVVTPREIKGTWKSKYTSK